MSDRERLSAVDIFRLGAASAVLLTWIGVVIFASLHGQQLDFGVHAVSLVAAGYLFASPAGKALRRIVDPAPPAREEDKDARS